MSFEEGDISQMDLSYQPESEVEESDADENVPLGKLQVQEKTEIEQVQQVEQVDQTVPVEQALSVEQAAPVESAVSLPQQTPEPVEREAPLPAQPATLPKGSAPVDGFQLVQATGLTDTSTSAPKGSEIPSFATPTPIPSLKATPAPVLEAPPVPQASADNNPLMDGSKSQVFRERSDFMIAEFFSRQVGRLTGGAPAALDRSYRIFQQRFKERLGSQWAHITSQPEVEEAIARVQAMYDYFESLEKIVRRQQTALVKVNDVESEAALWYRKEGVSEPEGPIRENMLYLSQSYMTICHDRQSLISSYEQYLEFLSTFKTKAVGDALSTMKKQNASRLELDAYGSKLGQLEERKLKTFARAPSASESSALEKDLKSTRVKFQDAKTKYQNLSTSLIDKSGLLDLKKGVDFAAHIAKIREVHDKFNKGRTDSVPVPVIDEEYVDDYQKEHGVRRSDAGLELAKEA